MFIQLGPQSSFSKSLFHKFSFPKFKIFESYVHFASFLHSRYKNRAIFFVGDGFICMYRTYKVYECIFFFVCFLRQATPISLAA